MVLVLVEVVWTGVGAGGGGLGKLLRQASGKFLCKKRALAEVVLMAQRAGEADAISDIGCSGAAAVKEALAKPTAPLVRKDLCVELLSGMAARLLAQVGWSHTRQPRS